MGTIFASAFVFQGFFDVAVTSYFEKHNRGKLWKDIKGKYVEGGDDEEEEDDDE